MKFYGKLNKITKDKINNLTSDEYLGLIIIISMLGMLIAGVIWWLGKDIIHELRHQNHLLREKNEKDKTL